MPSIDQKEQEKKMDSIEENLSRLFPEWNDEGRDIPQDYLYYYQQNNNSLNQSGVHPGVYLRFFDCPWL